MLFFREDPGVKRVKFNELKTSLEVFITSKQELEFLVLGRYFKIFNKLMVFRLLQPYS
jgi:hypothetical protein